MMSLPVVLLIVISSNYREGNVQEPEMLPAKVSQTNPSATLREVPLKEITSRVNDLKLFVDESKKVDIVVKKNTERVDTKEEKSKKEQGPMPLYSLVKNVCEQGYVMDQNGVCQKAVVLRTGGKEFDSERRRKRFVQDQDVTGQKNLKPFFEHFNKPFQYRKLLARLKGTESVECGNIYPGLVPDGAGGCKKAN